MMSSSVPSSAHGDFFEFGSKTHGFGSTSGGVENSYPTGSASNSLSAKKAHRNARNSLGRAGGLGVPAAIAPTGGLADDVTPDECKQS